MLKQKVKKPEEVRGRLDIQISAYVRDNPDADLEDAREVKKLLEGVAMLNKDSQMAVSPDTLTDDELKLFSDYLRSKKMVDAFTDIKLEDAQTKMGESDPADAETALDAIREFETMLLDENVRLQENMPKGEGKRVCGKSSEVLEKSW